MSKRSLPQGATSKQARTSLLVALGLFPSIAVTTLVSNAVVLGLCVLAALLAVSLVASLLRHVVEERGQVFVHVVAAALAATGASFAVQAIVPSAGPRLGIYVALIAVNGIVLDRATSYARASEPGRALLDALLYGVGFLVCLVLVALVRETLGSGSITFFPIGQWKGIVVIPGLSKNPVRVAALPAGALLAAGYLLALYRRLAPDKGGASE